ncbi:undecaprenyl-phosphate glucose phosphotransferase [Ketobacter sp.]
MQRGFLREHYWMTGILQRLADSGAVFLSALMALWICSKLFADYQLDYSKYSILIFLSIVLSILVFSRFDIYRSWRGISKGREIRILIAAWASVFAILACVSFATKTGDQYSRIWVSMWLLIGCCFLVLSRVVQRYFVDWLRSNGFNQRHIVIVGEGELGQQVYRRISDLNALGFQVNGYFQFGRPDDFSKRLSGVESGIASDFFKYIHRNSVDQVWIAMPFNRINQIRRVLVGLQHSTIDVRLVSDTLGYQLLNQQVTEIAGLPVVDLAVSPMNGFNRFLKALEDKVLALSILLLISPLMILIAIAVKVTSPGPILFRQVRISWNGKPFNMYKFRSMPVGVEQASGAVWAKKGENRATTVGTFLRRTSLDELPQFWNVLMGDMSIVGPRPERPVFVERFKAEIPGYMQKHKVKAGITGWAQVNGWRGDTDLGKRIEYDLFYIKNWSLWLDLKIIWLTLFRGFVNQNAY